MTGRGFLKSRLAQMNVKNSEEPQKSLDKIESSNLVSSNGIQSQGNIKVTGPVVSNGIHPQAARGRRAIIDRMAEQLKSNVNITTGFSSTKHEDSNNLKSQSSPLSMNKIDNLPTTKQKFHTKMDSQEQPMPIEVPENEQPPVLYRVPEKSARDNYKMTKLSSNYIKIEIEENKGAYEYYVAFSPLIDAISTKHKLLNQHQEIFPVKTFDGTLLYTPTKLPNYVTKLTAKLLDEVITMTITFKKILPIKEYSQFYNVLLHSIMNNLDFVKFGKNHYDPNNQISIPEFKLKIWPGFSSTIDEFENGLYLCCDISHRILRVETVQQTMIKIIEMANYKNNNVQQELMAYLIGMPVITLYNNKTYRIDDIDFNMTPLSTFTKNNAEISYVDYYKQMYDIKIIDLKQPLLISKIQNHKNQDVSQKELNICLVPELCNLTGLSEEMKNDSKLMQALKTYTAVTPEMRQDSLVNFINRMNDHEKAKKKLDSWGLKFKSIPVQLEGPVYKKEIITLGNGIKKQVGINMDWGLDVAKNAMFRVADLIHWAVLCTSKDTSIAREFCRQLSICGPPLGMQISAPIFIDVKRPNAESFVNSINITVNKSKKLQLVVIIVPSLREDRYNAIKRMCCGQLGIPSQVIISRTLSRPDRLRSITQKIALQMNCKLGGACWAIDIPLVNTMIVGVDVYHQKNSNTSSVVGFVASTNNTFTDWISIAKIQNNSHQEIFSSIHTAMFKALNKFKEVNKLLPEKIIIYRDGVSDGDLKIVEEYEICGLQESFKSYSPDYSPMLTHIIVRKRISTKIFQFLDDKYSNPVSGTVIDNTITKRNYFDFFLVSQHVRQGTVNPSHYIVLKNGCNLSIENVQRLSYKLCHMYYNWCGTIKVPAPAQYAHKLAFLIGQNVRKMPHENLSNTLFYL